MEQQVSHAKSVRDAVRVLAVLCGLVLALILSGVVYVLSRSTPALSYGAIIPLLLGFAAFRFARTPSAPARPLRLTVGVSTMILGCLLIGLGWPPDRGDWASWGIIVGSIVLTVSAAFIATRRPRLASWLLFAPATLAMFRMPGLVVQVRRMAVASDPGPSVVYAYLLASGGFAALAVALWHSWDIPPAVRSPDDA